MTINIEHIYKTCSHVHYFPGNFIVDYDSQTFHDLAEIVTKAIIEHNFEQAIIYDTQGHLLMVVTQT